MILTDTHCHLYSEDFQTEQEAVIQRAFQAGVSRIYLPNIDADSIEGMHKLVDTYPENCFAMMGLHPCYVKDDYLTQLALMESLLSKRTYCAIGEIGIDLYWDKTHLQAQQDAFKIQCTWAKEHGLPIAIHVREAFNELFELMDELNDDNLRGVFHCFSGDSAQAERALNYGGFKLGIGGVLTYKKSGLDAVVNNIALEHLVLETDAPYLAPVPFRGKQNEPSYTVYIAQRLAEIKGLTLEDVAAITTKNASELFKAL